MAQVTTIRTESEQELIDEMLGEKHADAQSFDNLREAACIAARRGALVRMLEEFDTFCEAAGARYFLLADALKGAVSYGGFIPGSASASVGMLRPDYRRFSRACEEAAAGKGPAPKSWRLSDRLDDKRRALARFPRLRAASPAPVLFEGDPVFDKDSLPMEVNPFVEISIFDEVPDDFFTRKKFYRQMKRRNAFYQRTVKAHKIVFGQKDEDFTEEEAAGAAASLGFASTLGHALVPMRLASWVVRHLAGRYEGQGTEDVARVQGPRSKTVRKTDLGECPRRSFEGLSLRCPERPDAWASEPVLETTPELKRLQDDAKEIVREIDRVCKELGIGYFCCGGTMLGYVRHGGFIPWDDDIDVGMLRPDYERFKAEAPGIIDGDRFFVQTRESDPNIPYLFSKVRMNGTEYLTDYNIDRDFHKGICVDVFPFDYVPNGLAELRAFKKEARKAARAHHRVVNRQYPRAATEPAGKNRDLDWMIAQLNGRILARHYWGMSLDETQAAYDEVATAYNSQAEELGLRYVASFVPTYTMVKVDGDLLPYQRVNFDGMEVSLPARPEVFLRMQYGDYMVMPYPHQRAGHDLLLWSDEDGVGGGRLAG